MIMAKVCHVTSSSGLGKFQADGFLFDRNWINPIGTEIQRIRFPKLSIISDISIERFPV